MYLALSRSDEKPFLNIKKKEKSLPLKIIDLDINLVWPKYCSPHDPILTTEPRWVERGVKEAIYIRALNASLNRDGGRYKLSLTSVGQHHQEESERRQAEELVITCVCLR